MSPRGTDLESDLALVSINTGPTRKLERPELNIRLGSFTLGVDKNVDVEEADDLIIDCLPKRAEDTVEWSRDGVPHGTGNFLVFRDIKKTDAGHYRCTTGSLTKNITVAIKGTLSGAYGRVASELGSRPRGHKSDLPCVPHPFSGALSVLEDQLRDAKTCPLREPVPLGGERVQMTGISF